MVRRSSLLATAVLVLMSVAPLHAQTTLGTAITYQGRLTRTTNGVPISDAAYDFCFTLYGDQDTGPQIGNTECRTGVPLQHGVFTVTLDFGPVFTGDELWLEVTGRKAGTTDTYTRFLPRQRVTATPYALWAMAGPGTGGGIDAIQPGPGLTVTPDPNGPVVTVGVASNGITSELLADQIQLGATGSPGRVGVMNAAGTVTGWLLGDDVAGLGRGQLLLHGPDGLLPGVELIAGSVYGSDLGLADNAGQFTVDLRSGNVAQGAELRLKNGQSPNVETITLDAKGPHGGGFLEMKAPNGATRAQLWGGEGVNIPDSALRLFNSFGKLLVNIEGGTAASGYGGDLVCYNASDPNEPNHQPDVTAALQGGGVHNGGRLRLWNGDPGSNRETITLYGSGGTGAGAGSGRIEVGGGSYSPVIIEGGIDTNGHSRVSADCFQNTGGCDLAEVFDHAPASSAEAGVVMVIDAANPGKLTVSTEPYDTKVAGVISGAGGLRPGMLLGIRSASGVQQRDGENRSDLPLALAGRVYCYVDATEHAVAVGDLLTTSATPGYAMKAADPTRTPGAVLGKAMEPLAQGEKGLILVLVSLQ